MAATTEDGRDYTTTYFEDGPVAVSNLSCYFYGDASNCPIIPDAKQGIAHAYGQVWLPNNSRSYSEISDILNSNENWLYYAARERREFAYRFSEFNVDDVAKVYPRFTDQIITATATERYEYNPNRPERIANETVVAWNYTYANDSFTDQILIPMISEQSNTATYIYRGAQVPENETEWNCGDRCIWIWAHRGPPTEGIVGKSTLSMQDRNQPSEQYEMSCPRDLQLALPLHRSHYKVELLLLAHGT